MRHPRSRKIVVWGLCLSVLAGCDADRLGGSGGSDGSGGGTTTKSTSDTGAGGQGGDASGPAAIDPNSPLGARFDADGHLQIAVRSMTATRIEAWLYAAPTDAPEKLTVVLTPGEEGYFRGVVSQAALSEQGLSEVVYYGLRAWGPGWPWDEAWTPGSEEGFEVDVDEAGNRFDPNKLLLDPYARETSHDPRTPAHTDGKVFGTGPEHRAKDSASVAPKGVVWKVPTFDTGAPPNTPLADQTIYEVHVRGFTKADLSLPEELRGTYAGAAAKAAYLKDLGVTTIELLPVHETQNEQNDIDPESASGDNYWGYSSISFFSPERRYASDKSPGGPTREFAEMVKAFHGAGISVILDVVYNHTAEGGTWDSGGQTATMFSWRGLDNTGYYQLGKDPWKYQNDNGVAPNLAAKRPLARDMVIDSLRYFHEVLGVDGFRFDLAPILANGCEKGCFSFDAGDPNGILKRAVAELPGVPLIAEPWGTGPGTYQVGHFPKGWSEWNDQFRNAIRDDQNKDGSVAVTPGWLADRLSGSWSLFGDDGRAPWASVNHVVSHDGFTLRDVYKCNGKNNAQAWPYGPSDGGSDDNHSWDQGGSKEAQRQAARTGLALLMVSAGVPMIVGGDEMYRTQKCNNNPYNLDSIGSWHAWTDLTDNALFFKFARGILRFRAAHPALRPDHYRSSKDNDGNGLPEIRWLRDNGNAADAAYLDNPNNDFLAFQVDGEEAGDSARSLYVAYNGWTDGIQVTLPKTAPGHTWKLVADTHVWLEPEGNFIAEDMAPPYTDPTYLLGKRAVLVLAETLD